MITKTWYEENSAVTYNAKLHGLAAFVPVESTAYAIYGQFERVGRSVYYNAYLGEPGDEGTHDDSLNMAQMLDDIANLKNGNVEF